VSRGAPSEATQVLLGRKYARFRLTRQRITRAILLVAGLALGGAVCAPTHACTVGKIDEWPVRWLAGRYAVVDGTLNGSPIGILLDTGATRSLILPSAAQRLDLPRRRTRSYRVFGVGGESPVEIAYIDQFSVGKTVRKGWQPIVAGAKELAPGIDVILGEDFFLRADVEFDLAHNAIRLLRATGCDGASLALAHWGAKGSGEVAMESINEAAPQIIVSVKVNGQPMRALLDSGAPYSMLTTSGAAAVGITPSAPGVYLFGHSEGLGAQSIETWVGPIDTFAMGNETIRDTAIHFGDLFKDVAVTGSGGPAARGVPRLPQMLLGSDFLRTHRVLLSHSQRKMYFYYLGGQVFQPRRPAAPPARALPATGDARSR